VNELKQLTDKINEFKQRTNDYLLEVKNTIHDIERENRPIDPFVLSYFTYSTSLSHDNHSENIIIANFHILNLSDQTLKNPIICIQLSENSPFSFTGKYILGDSQQQASTNDTWQRMNEQADENEYWLRPMNQDEIKPYEELVYSQFQLKWFQAASYSGSVNGFVYFDQKPEGMSAINPINMSGQM